MHTSGQPFVMSFQAGGPHAQDRALEAVAAGLVEQERVPASVVWEKPGKDREGKPAPLRMQKDYRLVPRGVALVIGCNTFPTWNAYPGIFASLVTGNAVVVKPHPRAVLPLAISVEVARDGARGGGLRPGSRPARRRGGRAGPGQDPGPAPEVAIIDYTGGPGFGAWLEESARGNGTLVYTEKAGLNSIVVDSTDDLRGMLGNLAFSLTLYSGQMCTAPQNLYVPADGIDTDEGHLSFDELADRLAAAVTRLTGDDAKAVELLGATVNDQVRANADGLASLAEQAGGRVVLDSRRVDHPTWADAVVRAPGLVALDVAREDVYTQSVSGRSGSSSARRRPSSRSPSSRAPCASTAR